MKTQPVLAAFMFGLLCLVSTNAAGQDTAGKAAKILNQQAQRSLGVSIRALAYLFDAEPGSVLSMRSVALQQSWHHLEALEQAGMVKLHKFGGSGADYLRIELTPKGAAVARELHGP